jgi:hypothetical protein
MPTFSSSQPACPWIPPVQAGDHPSAAPAFLLVLILLASIAAAMLMLPAAAENHLRSTPTADGKVRQRVRYRAPWRRGW